jgi:hypothetical protein
MLQVRAAMVNGNLPMTTAPAQARPAYAAPPPDLSANPAFCSEPHKTPDFLPLSLPLPGLNRG